MKKLISKTLTLGLLTFVAVPQAESVRMITDHVPSADEMGAILFKKSSQTSNEQGSASRSLKFKTTPTTTAQQPSASNSSSDAIGLPISFDLGEASIRPDSYASLDEVGKMMTKPAFSNEKLKIEGHTDAFGSDKGNQQLSEQRATSVKNYLEKEFNIAPERLLEEGYGEQQPLPDTNPYDGKNRRVQFKAAQ
jgi:outer membrane protein OmpA-like peptidoglycan-associated protein